MLPAQQAHGAARRAAAGRFFDLAVAEIQTARVAALEINIAPVSTGNTYQRF